MFCRELLERNYAEAENIFRVHVNLNDEEVSEPFVFILLQNTYIISINLSIV